MLAPDTPSAVDWDHSVADSAATGWPEFPFPALHADARGCVPSDTHPAMLARPRRRRRDVAVHAAERHGSVLPCLASADAGSGSSAARRLASSATAPTARCPAAPAYSTTA